MSASFTEVHDELRAVARDLLGKGSPGAAADRRLLADSGWLGLEVPEALDGAGSTFAEVAVVLEEMGRAATSGSYLGAVVLGVGALSLAEPTPGRDELLRETASGGVILAAAIGDAEDRADVQAPFNIERLPHELRLHGRGAATLVAQRGHGDSPAVVQAADHVEQRDADSVQEVLVELRRAG